VAWVVAQAWDCWWLALNMAMDVRRRLVALLNVCHVAKSCCECVSE